MSNHFVEARRLSCVARWLALIIAIVAIINAACSGNKSNTSSPAPSNIPATVTEDTKNPLTDLAAAAGKPLYAKNCAFCHGETGKGDGPGADSVAAKPTDLTTGDVPSDPDGEIFLAIKKGKMKDGKVTMPPAKKLTDEQIWQVVAYVRTLAKK